MTAANEELLFIMCEEKGLRPQATQICELVDNLPNDDAALLLLLALRHRLGTNIKTVEELTATFAQLAGTEAC
jgi:hypothetical protein